MRGVKIGLINYYYWVKTEEERLRFYDFYHRSRPNIIKNGSLILKEPLILNDGTIIGEKDRLSVVILFSILEKNIIDEMIQKSIITPENLFESNDIEQDSEKCIYFESNYKMVQYLNKKNHIYRDGSIPTHGLHELENWLIYLPSKVKHDLLSDALFRENMLQNSFGYSILKGSLLTKDGRVFGQKGKITLYLGIMTTFDYNCVYQLISDRIVDKYNAIQHKNFKNTMFEDVRFRDLKYLRKPLKYLGYLDLDEFQKFFSTNDYIFEDGSRLTSDDIELFERQKEWSKKIQKLK